MASQFKSVMVSIDGRKMMTNPKVMSVADDGTSFRTLLQALLISAIGLFVIVVWYWYLFESCILSLGYFI